jgi:hypothetical protein
MAKFKLKTKEVNHRVEVFPFEPWFMGSKDPEERATAYHDACKNIRRNIERHVDDVRQTYIESDTVCFYCDSPEQLDENGRPICCEDAIRDYDEFIKRNAKLEPLGASESNNTIKDKG